MPEGAYNEDFDPAVRPGDEVYLPYYDEFRTVTDYLKQPIVDGFRSDVTIAAGDTARDIELRPLERDDGKIAQYRLITPDQIPEDVEIRVDFRDEENQAYSTRRRTSRLTQELFDELGLKFSELYIFEDDAHYFTVENKSESEVTFNPSFAGYVFSLSEPHNEPSGQPVYLPTSTLQYD